MHKRTISAIATLAAGLAILRPPASAESLGTPLLLDAAVSLALERNPGYRIAHTGVIASRARLQTVRVAAPSKRRAARLVRVCRPCCGIEHAVRRAAVQQHNDDLRAAANHAIPRSTSSTVTKFRTPTSSAPRPNSQTNRGDVTAARAAIDAATYAVKEARSGRAPHVDIVVAVGNVQPPVISGYRNQFSVGLNAVWMLFDNGAVAGNVAAPRAGIDQAKLTLEQLQTMSSCKCVKPISI